MMRWLLCTLLGHHWQQFSTEWCGVPYFRCARCDCTDHACNHAFGDQPERALKPEQLTSTLNEVGND